MKINTRQLEITAAKIKVSLRFFIRILFIKLLSAGYFSLKENVNLKWNLKLIKLEKGVQV